MLLYFWGFNLEILVTKKDSFEYLVELVTLQTTKSSALNVSVRREKMLFEIKAEIPPWNPANVSSLNSKRNLNECESLCFFSTVARTLELAKPLQERHSSPSPLKPQRQNLSQFLNGKKSL